MQPKKKAVKLLEATSKLIEPTFNLIDVSKTDVKQPNIRIEPTKTEVWMGKTRKI